METAEQPARFSSVLRSRTHLLHSRAERSGFIAEMLRGRATRRGYTIFLRNLLPAYEQLEAGLERHRTRPAMRELALREVYRADALSADLAELSGQDWRHELPLLPAAQHYADRVQSDAQGEGEALLGHAYVRYLGDLNGGQVLGRLLAKSLALPAEALSFYRFPLAEDLDELRIGYRAALDRAGAQLADWSTAINAAVDAFALNIEVSEAVCQHVAEDPCGPNSLASSDVALLHGGLAARGALGAPPTRRIDET
jgi:heme oxygenase